MKFSRLIAWLPLGFAITIMSAVVYGAVQQVYRQGADDPQIQIAEDASNKILHGADPVSVVPTETVDLQTSLAPFIMVIDSNGKVLASNARLDGQAVVPPAGVIQSARTNGSNRVTWQPAPNVREALVVIGHPADNRALAVAVGRSLREVERRESQLTMMIGLGWAIAMLGSLGWSIFVGRPERTV